MSRVNSDPIVITGIGVVTPLGNNIEETFQNVLDGKTGISAHDFNHLKEVPIAKCVQTDFGKYLNKKERRRTSYAGQLCIYSAYEALSQAGINDPDIIAQAGIYIGVTSAGTLSTELNTEKLYTDPDYVNYIPPYINNHLLANSPSGELSLKLQTGAAHYTIGAACAAGNMGVIQACQMVNLNEVPFAIAGGVSDLAYSVNASLGFLSQGALSRDIANDCSKSCLPLCQDRPGVVIGDGCGLFILEKESRAKRRGATILAYVDAYGSSSDYSSFAEPQVDGQIRCLENLFSKSSIPLEQISAVNLHATGTNLGDQVEMETIKTFFKQSCPPTYALKGYLGHTMGAAGAIELAISIESMRKNILPACYTAHGKASIAKECFDKQLILKSNQPEKHINSVLNNSFGFFGINSSILIRSGTH